MTTREFFGELKDPLKDKKTIDILVNCYEESLKFESEDFSYEMYKQIVRTFLDEKNIKK